jgi:hypothetical protein
MGWIYDRPVVLRILSLSLKRPASLYCSILFVLGLLRLPCDQTKARLIRGYGITWREDPVVPSLPCDDQVKVITDCTALEPLLPHQ